MSAFLCAAHGCMVNGGNATAVIWVLLLLLWSYSRHSSVSRILNVIWFPIPWCFTLCFWNQTETCVGKLMTYSQEATQGPTSIASSDVQDAVVTVVVVLSEVILTQKETLELWDTTRHSARLIPHSMVFYNVFLESDRDVCRQWATPRSYTLYQSIHLYHTDR